MKSVKKKLNRAKVPAKQLDPAWLAAIENDDERSYYRSLLKRFRKSKLTAWELKELRDKMGSKETTSSLPMRCSARSLAKILTEKYGAKSGNGSTRNFHAKEILGDWVKKKGMTAPGENNLFTTNEAIKWAETHIIGQKEAATGTIAEGEAAKNKTSVIQARRQERLEEEELRKMDKRWMLSEAHDFWCDNVGTAAHLTVCDLVERRVRSAVETILKANVTDAGTLEKLLEAARPVFSPLFEEWQQEFAKKILEIDIGCQEMSEQKKAKLKVKLK